MSNTMPTITSLEQVLGKSCSREEALNSLKQHPESYAIFSSFRPEHQNTILSFMQGQCSLDITLDKFFLPSLDEYKKFFRIDEKLLKYAKKDAIVMHPGPIQRGIEISPGVIDSKQCIINDQIANSVAVRMAMFYILSQVGGAFK